MLTSDDNTYKLVEHPNPMVGTLVSVRMPPMLLEQAQTLAEKRGYGTVQDFIRETVRREIGYALLDALAGSQPGIKRSTRESRIEAQRAFFLEKGWDHDAFVQEHAANQRKNTPDAKKHLRPDLYPALDRTHKSIAKKGKHTRDDLKI